jgi:hypothetical protein
MGAETFILVLRHGAGHSELATPVAENVAQFVDASAGRFGHGNQNGRAQRYVARSDSLNHSRGELDCLRKHGVACCGKPGGNGIE